ncbi:MAG TPA: hypothetical protein VF719_04330 [Abditibacteriaceae bacterium]|jgi:uncharacterized membrane protein
MKTIPKLACWFLPGVVMLMTIYNDSEIILVIFLTYLLSLWPIFKKWPILGQNLIIGAAMLFYAMGVVMFTNILTILFSPVPIGIGYFLTKLAGKMAHLQNIKSTV